MKLIAPTLLLLLGACAAPMPTANPHTAMPALAPDPSALTALAETPDTTAPGTDATPSSATDLPTAGLLAAGSNSNSEPQGGPPPMGRAIPYEPGALNLTLGARFMENSDWDQLDNQFAMGLDYTIRSPLSWIGLNIGGLGSFHRTNVGGIDLDSWMAEATIGPRAYLFFGPNVPFYCYGGIGASLVYGELESTDQRRNKTTVGGSASAGVMYRLNMKQALGLEFRTLQFADFDGGPAGAPDDMNYNQISLVFSAGF